MEHRRRARDGSVGAVRHRPNGWARRRAPARRPAHRLGLLRGYGRILAGQRGGTMVRGRHDQEGRMAEGAGLDAPITGVTVFKEGARAAWWRGEPGARAMAGSDWQPAGNRGSGLRPHRRAPAGSCPAERRGTPSLPRRSPSRRNRAAAFGGRKVARRCVEALDDEDTSPAAAGRHRPPSELAAARGRLDLSPHGAAGDTGDQAAEPGTSRSCGNPMLRPAV